MVPLPVQDIVSAPVPKYSTIEVMTGAIIQKPFDTVIPIEQINFVRSKHGAKYILINKNKFI